MEIRNAVIEETFLGIEDHDILTYHIRVKTAGMTQIFGGRGCDSSFLPESVRKILETLKVCSWEKLKGTYVRIEGSFSEIVSIGHVVEERWYNIKEHAEQFDKEHP